MLRCGKPEFVFQNLMVALAPTLRIDRQVALTIGGKPADGQGADTISGAELPELVMRAYQFAPSGCIAQRMVIAIATVRNPDIQICGESTASLDASARGRLTPSVGALQRELAATLP